MKKKLLLGTTALIAAGVVSGGVAQAAEEPITAGVGGYFRSAMGLISSRANAPVSWRVTPAGLVNGPRMLNIVRVPSSARVGIT